MNIFDIVIPCFLGVGLIVGIWRGLVYGIFTTLAVPVSFGITYLFHDKIIQRFLQEGTPSSQMHILVYIGTFLFCYLTLLFITIFLLKLLRLVKLSVYDRVLGGVFGVVKNALIAMVIVIGLVTYSDNQLMEPMRESHAVLTLIRASTWLHQRLPEPYKSSTKKYLESLLDLTTTPIEKIQGVQDER